MCRLKAYLSSSSSIFQRSTCYHLPFTFFPFALLLFLFPSSAFFFSHNQGLGSPSDNGPEIRSVSGVHSFLSVLLLPFPSLSSSPIGVEVLRMRHTGKTNLGSSSACRSCSSLADHRPVAFELVIGWWRKVAQGWRL
ncbi:hypothetical protein SLEP1_g3062 [Rubroshorea leprosula]|uniref:Uncharacterized protein n=1 Tax=Rubroshorea leprosula TaxID=152421 RepID=A0AAV5HPY2_9ROSI|nr:hypothetical protein SLEP1_g3062 [Rubroshorea leprosula]